MNSELQFLFTAFRLPEKDTMSDLCNQRRDARFVILGHRFLEYGRRTTTCAGGVLVQFTVRGLRPLVRGACSRRRDFECMLRNMVSEV